jgi:PST family polysaccharide transporter
MGLRDQSLRGGSYLVVREAVGYTVRFGGVVLVSRLIGPSDYGIYAAALAVTTALATIAWFGVDTYLVRGEGDLPLTAFHQAFWLLAATSGAVTVVALGIELAASPWLRDEGYLGPLLVMTALIPIKVMWTPAQAQLERSLRYRRMAMLEISADFSFYFVAIPLAAAEAGPWAAVAGFAVWQLWLLVGSYALVRYRPRWQWERHVVRDMLGYGAGYSSSVWLERCRDLVPTIVLGRFAGPESVGYASLTLRIMEALTFGKKVVRRVSLVAVARVQRDAARVGRGLQEGMVLQLLAVGPFLVGFSLVAPWAVRIGFGEEWEPVADIVPYVSIAFLFLSAFTMHRTTLYVLRRNLDVTKFFAAHLVLLFGGALVFMPRYGLKGYGLAEVVAIAANVLLIHSVAREVTISYRAAIRWAVAFVSPLCAQFVPMPWAPLLYLPLILPLLDGPTRRQLRSYAHLIRAPRPAADPLDAVTDDGGEKAGIR